MKKQHKREAILWTVIVLQSLLLFYLIMLNLWGLRVGGPVIDYTRFGTWSNALSGIGTSVAVVVALTAQFWQRKTRREDDKAKLLEAEVAVFQWLNLKEVRNANGHLEGRIWDIKVQNSTDAPIYHWQITFGSKDDHICSPLKRPLMPGENYFNLLFLDNVEPSNTPEPTLIFEDRSERVWIRSARGVLIEVTKEQLRCEHYVA